MSTPHGGIPDADWLLWLPETRQFILAQQREIEKLRSQLAAQAIELASLREKIGRSSRNASEPPSSDGPGFSRRHGVRAVAAKVAGSLAIPDRGLSCYESSEWMRWWSATLKPAVDAEPCCKERIQRPCANR